ncbi:MAG: hypothetical protein D3M94_08425 [Rhodocyclales bacterium GT-UBC]|nr:MAG: hypothetical protein D3M94_08425 [Rhodocyclales bacterium GT-UBC]
MNAFRQTCLSLWQARTAAERRALRGLAIVLALAALLQFSWSAYQARQTLRRQVPELARAAETMQQHRQAWLALEQSPTTPRAAPGHKEIERRLQALGALTVTWSGESQLQIDGEVAFAAWIDLLAELQREHGLVVSRLRALPAGPGHIGLHAELNGTATP